MIVHACRPASTAGERVRRPISANLPRNERPSESFTSNDEPTLIDLIDDPVTRRLMASDGVDRDGLLALLGEMRETLLARA
ncbi:MAG: hypothetical protein HQL40_02590 [Alphaproteobacteria bacterium]|nr:hypothetical protein [Alphaproteobacteria bacterium]